MSISLKCFNMDHIDISQLIDFFEYLKEVLKDKTIRFFFKCCVQENMASNTINPANGSDYTLGDLMTRVNSLKMATQPIGDEKPVIETEDGGLTNDLLVAVSKIKHVVGADFFFKDMWKSNFDSHFEGISKFSHLQELVLFQLLSFQALLDDLDWISMPSLKSLNLTIFYLTLGQYQEMFVKLPQAFKNLLTLSLKIIDMDSSQPGMWKLDNMSKTNMLKLDICVQKMSKPQTFQINTVKQIPVKSVKFTNFKTLVLHQQAITQFQNLVELKLFNIIFPTE